MLLGLSLIIGGTDPLLVGLLPLFCLFTFTHINRDIESGHIVDNESNTHTLLIVQKVRQQSRLPSTEETR